MAIVWQKQTSHKLYEVRRAGNSMRLYTNGVLHTQFNPRSPVTGSVWDLLSLGGFGVPEGNLRRILALGVGGGASLLQLNQWFQPEEIIGVELSSVHLKIAKRFFGLDTSPFRLIKADALKWIKDYRGPKFDLIIDDMFAEDFGEPYRVATADREWFGLLKRQLSPKGSLVLNFIDAQSFRYGVAAARNVGGFRAGFRLSTHNCENIVGVFGRSQFSSRELQEKLRKIPELDTRKLTCKLKYNIRTIKDL